MKLQIGSRVALSKYEEEDIPDGSLATVVDIFPGDDTTILVIPDCRPNIRLHYYDHEVGTVIKEQQ